MGKVLGLTGGIATGKTTVVNIFKELGYPIVDGDVIARKVVEPGKEGLAALVKVFGSEILLETGQLNREKLGLLIFADETKRKLLDNTLGPFIRKEIVKQIAQAKRHNPLVIADIPLLYEYQYEKIVDLVAVVYVPEGVQLQRLMERNQLDEAEALNRMKSQWPIEAKKKRAAVLFDNQGTHEETRKQVLNWLHSYLKNNQ